jgi:hypothetical protein
MFFSATYKIPAWLFAVRQGYQEFKLKRYQMDSRKLAASSQQSVGF